MGICLYLWAVNITSAISQEPHMHFKKGKVAPLFQGSLALIWLGVGESSWCARYGIRCIFTLDLEPIGA